MDNLINTKIITEIETLLQKARAHVAAEVNRTILTTYMQIGQLIFEDINSHVNKDDYQAKTISMLSKKLTREFGKGFSVQTSGTCLPFIRSITAFRHCLNDSAGHITVSLFPYLTEINGIFMKWNAQNQNGVSES